jgi:hypothetical protein
MTTEKEIDYKKLICELREFYWPRHHEAADVITQLIEKLDRAQRDHIEERVKCFSYAGLLTTHFEQACFNYGRKWATETYHPSDKQNKWADEHGYTF